MESHPDGLSDLERRLAALAPSGTGLDADRMLFAAGRASAPPARRGAFWPAVAALLTLLSVGLAAAWLDERAEHRALAEQWDRAMRRPLTPATAEVPEPSSSQSDEVASANGPASESVLQSHRILEAGLDGLAAAPPGPAPGGTTPSDVPILRARSTDEWPGL
jgi:hypothetical protein